MPTIGKHFIDRLRGLTKHIFGVPGDYTLNFYDQLNQEIPIVGTTDEQCAGFAADAYARITGFGCVCVTYCVGGFKVLNAIAGANAEKSPVLIISGSPGAAERESGMLLHHMSGTFDSQQKMFQNITCANAILDNPSTAGYEIDRVLKAIKYFKRPGYIELPRDMVNRNIKYDISLGSPPEYVSDKDGLAESIMQSVDFISKSKNPVIVAGVEIARFNLGKDLIKFAEACNIPVACSLLGKSVVNEKHPLFLGTYCGAMSEENTRNMVESSDCVIMLGVMQTDMNLAFQPLKRDLTNVVMSHTGECRIRRSKFEKINFVDFATNLFAAKIPRKVNQHANTRTQPKFVPTNNKITSTRLFAKINSLLDQDMGIIADVGDSLFGAADLVVHYNNQFLASAFYASMGFAVPAALGAGCANKKVRNMVFVGDGAFQMTGMEVSSIARLGMNPIIFVLNNRGYATERFLLDGDFNDVQEWNYYKVSEVINGGKGYLVQTEEDLENVMPIVLKNSCVSIVQVNLDKYDCTPALKRLTQNLSNKI